MARPLFVSSSSSSSMPMMTLLFVVLSVLSILSVTTNLCGTRKIKKLKAQTEEPSSRRRSCSSNKNRLIKKLNSSLSNRAISMVKMLSWRKVEAEEEQVGEEEDEHEMRCYSDQDEEALWRKNILMGERCRPIDFSGNIDHDFEGNVVPQSSSSHRNGHH